MPLSDQQVHALLTAVRETHEEELDCAAFLDDMAAFAENRVRGLPPKAALARAEEHLRLCANCSEECEALVTLLRAERA